MLRDRLIADLDRQMLRTWIAVAARCVSSRSSSRGSCLLLDGPSPFDIWLSDHIRQPHPSQGLKLVERLAALLAPSRCTALILGVAAWAWLRRRDVRPGVLLIGAFVVTKASVDVLKTVLLHMMPISAPIAVRRIAPSCPRMWPSRSPCSGCWSSSSGSLDAESCSFRRWRWPSRWSCRRAIGDGDRRSLLRRRRVRGGGRRLLGRHLRCRG